MREKWEEGGKKEDKREGRGEEGRGSKRKDERRRRVAKKGGRRGR